MSENLFVNKPKILVIDDSESILFLLNSILSNFFEIHTTQNPKKALETLDKTFDLIILDLMMPEMSGIEFIKLFKAKEDFQYIPIIVLTAKYNNENDIAKLFELGVNDYISKPFFPTELIARIKTHTKIKFLTDVLLDANKKLSYSATHDDLTKVFNRNAIFDFLENNILRIKRSKKHLSLLMFDIDFFKEINDNYGHLAGDAILFKIVEIVKDTIREIDIIGRYGGDEFLIILPETNLENAIDIGSRILDKIRKEKYKINKTTTIIFSISLGISVYKKNESIDSFIERVDKALYDAKNSGRNCLKVR